MRGIELKLKQASAVLGIRPKDLQNLVQFGVVSPRRRRHVYWFDEGLLLQAKVAVYLKESLGTPTRLLRKFTSALFRDSRRALTGSFQTVRVLSRPRRGQTAIEISIPMVSLARELEGQLPMAKAHPDLPRGRKRRGWREELFETMEAAATDLAPLSDEQILRALKTAARRKSRSPEITIVVETEEEAAARRR